MTDRELLELAAKAAGYAYRWIDSDAGPELRIVYSVTGDQDQRWDRMNWNPLKDDGEALRLAVKLKIKIDPDFHFPPEEDGYVSRVRGVWLPGDTGNPSLSGFGTDHEKVIRELIVRAAAEIGRKMP